VDPAAAIIRNRTEQQQAGGAEIESAKKTSKKRKAPDREYGDVLCVKKKVCACMQVCVDDYFA
jgi:ribosomal protein L34E